MNNRTIKFNTGFSLLETIVAISILMITIVGPLSLASKGIVFADYVKDEITGFYLAQEAVEAIRNIRDTNIKNNIDWLETIKDSCMNTIEPLTGVPCRIDIWRFDERKANGDQTDYGFQNCAAVSGPDVAECERLKVVDVGDPIVGSTNFDKVRLYGYEFNTLILNDKTPQDSMFSRKITIKNVTKDYLAMSEIEIPNSERSLLTLDSSGIDEINVTVEVSWARAGNPRSIRVSENLFSI